MWSGRKLESKFKGVNAERGCDKIYSVYGPSSTAPDIIKALTKGKKFGEHQALTIGTA